MARIERDWQLRIDTNAKRGGETHAQAFGENIAKGLQNRLESLAAEVGAPTRRFTWRASLLPWVLGIALAIPLTVGVCVSAFVPQATVKPPVVERPLGSKASVGSRNVIGLTAAQTREAVSKLSLCQVSKTNDRHACIQVDNRPRVRFGSVDKSRVVVRGM